MHFSDHAHGLGCAGYQVQGRCVAWLPVRKGPEVLPNLAVLQAGLLTICTPESVQWG